MKKKVIGGIAVLAIAALAAFNVNLNSQGHKLSNISLANVEALASNESDKYCGMNEGTKICNLDYGYGCYCE